MPDCGCFRRGLNETGCHEAAFRHCRLMADLRRPAVRTARPRAASQDQVLNVSKVASNSSDGAPALGHQESLATVRCLIARCGTGQRADRREFLQPSQVGPNARLSLGRTLSRIAANLAGRPARQTAAPVQQPRRSRRSDSVFYLQSPDAQELAGVVRHQRRALSKCVAGDP